MSAGFSFALKNYMLQILSLTLPVKTMKLLFRLLFAVLLCCVSAEAYAARVDILPRKIIIEDRARSGDLTLLNMGEKPIVVRLQILSYRQKPDGTYETLKGPLNPAFNPVEVVRFFAQADYPAGRRPPESSSFHSKTGQSSRWRIPFPCEGQQLRRG